MSEFTNLNKSLPEQEACFQGRAEVNYIGSRPVGGFSFENSKRNDFIIKKLSENGSLSAIPKTRKTGTTIVGVVYKDGVVLGADTRATGGTTVMDKNCEKIHYIAPNIYCCGAGTAADTEATTAMISSQLELLRLNTNSQSRVVTALTLLKRYLFQYQGHVSAALVLGGVDCTGAHLYSVYPHGSTDKLPFVTMGSGSLAAMAVFESGYKDGMNEEEARELVKQAILSGVFNDLGSGSNVDVTVIRKDGSISYDRNCITPNNVSDWRKGLTRPLGVDYPRGATAVVKEEFIPAATQPAADAMEVS